MHWECRSGANDISKWRKEERQIIGEKKNDEKEKKNALIDPKIKSVI